MVAKARDNRADLRAYLIADGHPEWFVDIALGTMAAGAFKLSPRT